MSQKEFKLEEAFDKLNIIIEELEKPDISLSSHLHYIRKA